MSPSQGMFVSVDPFAGDPQAPASLHRYLYAGADPVDRVDPDGRVFGYFDGALRTVVANVWRTASLLRYQVARQVMGMLFRKAAAGYVKQFLEMSLRLEGKSALRMVWLVRRGPFGKAILREMLEIARQLVPLSRDSEVATILIGLMQTISTLL